VFIGFEAGDYGVPLHCRPYSGTVPLDREDVNAGPRRCATILQQMAQSNDRHMTGRDGSPIENGPDEATGPLEPNAIVGLKLRELRQSRGASLADVARACNLSVSLLSQVERGIVSPSLATLHALSQHFGVPMFTFFMGDDERRLVVRKDERRLMTFPASNVTYELITPDTKGQLEVMEVVLKPGQESIDSGLPHPGEECGLVLEGTVTALLGSQEHELSEGDSIHFDAGIGHRYTNRTRKLARLLSVVTPPTF
jgi:transcriptional regulator with XRE-family HTH domain